MANVKSARILIVDETYDEVEKIISCFHKKNNDNVIEENRFREDITKGHFYRGV